MSRWWRLLAALSVSALAGFSVFAFVVVMGYGVMWLFIYGDSIWPAYAENFAQIGLPAIGMIAGRQASPKTRRKIVSTCVV